MNLIAKENYRDTMPREKAYSKNDLETAKSSLILLFERVDLRVLTNDPIQLNMMASMKHYAVGKLQELRF